MNERHQRIITLYTSRLDDGRQLTQKEVADLVGVSKKTVENVLKANSIPGGIPGPRKITLAMKSEVVRQYTARLPDGTWKGSKLIADSLGISDVAVLLILKQERVQTRTAKEAHAHGKRCGPFKHLQQFGQAPLCECGCGQSVEWLPNHMRWAKFIVGHRYQDAPYKNEAWLREQYEVLRRGAPEIAKECNVNATSIIRHMERFGIDRRDASAARIGTQAGANNPAWKGGTTPDRQRLYKTQEWKALIRSVFVRDEFTCQRCKIGTTGSRGNRQSCAHHIKSFAEHPDLRFDPANLVTLCRSCHLWVHSLANIKREFLG